MSVGQGTQYKSRKKNPQKLTQLSSRSQPRHLVGKRTAQKDTIIDITSDSQVNSSFPNRWSPASLTFNNYFTYFYGGGRVVRWCWVNFQCRGVLLVWITVGQGPTALTVGAGGGCLDIFILIYPFSPLPPSLWETARYRLKYCLKGPLNPKQPTNQPTNQLIFISIYNVNNHK